MIALALKWLTIALVLLTVFSAVTAVYVYYTLNFGNCRTGGPTCNTHLATLYASAIGVIGFGVSAYAAHVIGKGFSDEDPN